MRLWGTTFFRSPGPLQSPWCLLGHPERWVGDARAPRAQLPPLLGRREAASWEELSIQC